MSPCANAAFETQAELARWKIAIEARPVFDGELSKLIGMCSCHTFLFNAFREDVQPGVHPVDEVKVKHLDCDLLGAYHGIHDHAEHCPKNMKDLAQLVSLVLVPQLWVHAEKRLVKSGEVALIECIR